MELPGFIEKNENRQCSDGLALTSFLFVCKSLTELNTNLYVIGHGSPIPIDVRRYFSHQKSIMGRFPPTGRKVTNSVSYGHS